MMTTLPEGWCCPSFLSIPETNLSVLLNVMQRGRLAKVRHLWTELTSLLMGVRRSIVGNDAGAQHWALVPGQLRLISILQFGSPNASEW